MITFSKLEKKGHLGNQLFQIASTIGLAKKHGQDYVFAPWRYSEYFNNLLPEIKNYNFIHLPEKLYEYHDWEIKDDNYDIEGWLQTEKYFDIDLTRYYFSFKNDVVNKIKEKYKKAFEKQTILLSIRRGDFVNHPDYYQTPIKFYLGALIHHFNNWEDYNLIVLSDDIEYCKFHFEFLPNTYFGDGLNAVEQLCLGSLCNNFIIGNSTFSWWSAWLGEKENSKVIRPIKNFRGEKAKELNDKDYFPKRWSSFDYLGFKTEFDANIYIKKHSFLSSVTADFFSHFFNGYTINYIADIDKLPLNSDEKSIIYCDNIICSPVIIYYMYLQTDKYGKNIELVFNKKVIVNYKLSNYLFDDFKDFGIYSSMFNSKPFSSSHTGVLISYIGERNNFDNKLKTFYIGQFSKYSGYKFYLKQYQRKTTVFIKKSIKKILKINK